jgi:hypothetical protein
MGLKDSHLKTITMWSLQVTLIQCSKKSKRMNSSPLHMEDYLEEKEKVIKWISFHRLLITWVQIPKQLLKKDLAIQKCHKSLELNRILILITKCFLQKLLQNKTKKVHFLMQAFKHLATTSRTWIKLNLIKGLQLQTE